LPASITNPAARAAESGSNAAAYSQLNDLTLIPALSTIEQSDLSQKRLGLTGTLQWRPFDRTLLTFDSVYSHFEQEQINYQIAPIGLNRNNTNATYNTATALTAASVKRSMYNTCVSRVASATQDAIDCGEQLYGTTPVFAGGFSLNPNNLEPYEYYNNPGSVGYIADPTGRGLAYRNVLIGRPAIRLVDAHVNGANQADYLVLNNVDIRSAADASFYTTKFMQNSLSLTHDLTANMRIDGIYGRSRSDNDSTGLLAEFNRMDSPENFVYDERGGGSMPLLDFGFDTADPNSWNIAKGFSALRHYERTVTNKFETAGLSLNWAVNDVWGLEVGASDRTFDFATTQAQRLTSTIETLTPSLLELGKSVGDLSRTVSFGQGLDVPAGTPGSFIAPDLDAFREATGFDCNCVNKWGDWRISQLATPQNNYAVTEKDRSYFAQVSFAHDVFDRKLRGNIGVRYAQTDLEASGFTSGSRPIVGTNEYNDTLPSLNLAYEAVQNVLFRFGVSKVMARPQLGNLAPSITAISVPTTGLNTGGTMTVGNPKLEPFRGKNYDYSVEWYFARGALLSAAFFTKKIASFPQTVVSSQTLSSFLDADVIAQILAQQTNPNAIAYINADNPFDVRQFKTAPGGNIRGEEITYQQDLTFLPGFWKNFGIQANYTHIHSALSYIIDPGSVDGTRPQLVQPGPWTGASPNAFNFTLYYETQKWSARTSAAYREGYVTAYPVASGSCDPGVCDSPLFNEFIGSDDTLNVDASTSYSLNDSIQLTFEALNLTNQTSDRWAYSNSPVVAQYVSTGRQYFAGVRMRF
jgi:TonB-dependent receptor